MEETRIFPMDTDIPFKKIVLLLEHFLRYQEGLMTKRFYLGKKVVIQCFDLNGDLKQLLGIDTTLTIELEEINKTISVKIGNAKWMDKIGAATIGALYFPPLVITAGIGAVHQAILPDKIFTFIKNLSSKYNKQIISLTNLFDIRSNSQTK